MYYDVIQLAFGEGEIRKVWVQDILALNAEDDMELLSFIFGNGQNEIMENTVPEEHYPDPPTYSVSVGDVACVDGKFYKCMSLGWREINHDELEALKRMTAKERFMLQLKEAEDDQTAEDQAYRH